VILTLQRLVRKFKPILQLEQKWNGAPGRSRTDDRLIESQSDLVLLCQIGFHLASTNCLNSNRLAGFCALQRLATQAEKAGKLTNELAHCPQSANWPRGKPSPPVGFSFAFGVDSRVEWGGSIAALPSEDYF
jgi:hypothetical protein